MGIDRWYLEFIESRYSKGTLTEHDKAEYYGIKGRANDIGSPIEGLSSNEIRRRVGKYHKSIDAQIEHFEHSKIAA